MLCRPVILSWCGLQFLLFLLTMGLPPAAAADRLPDHEAVPGGIAVVPLDPDSDPLPEVRYGKRRTMVLRNDGHWYAIIGIPLSASPGEHSVTVAVADGKRRKQMFRVNPKDYKTQRLTIQNRRQVTPSPEDLKRIRREKDIIRNALRHWSGLGPAWNGFTLPVAGELSSPFGLHRYFNDQPRKPHSGLDIAAPEGTPIQAPAPGIVVTTGDFFFNGKSVFIDHGQNLITMYGHMSRIDVKSGQRLEPGDIIGAVGRTGRVTGPHLHWGVSLNDARVNPLLLLQEDSHLAGMEQEQ